MFETVIGLQHDGVIVSLSISDLEQIIRHYPKACYIIVDDFFMVNIKRRGAFVVS